MKNRIIKSKILAALLLGTVITTSVLNLNTARVFAEEAVAEGEAADPAAEGAVEGEVPLDGEGLDAGLDGAVDPSMQGGVTPGTILANNGLYIANTFPDSLMPAGFHRQTVAYQGQNIDLAYMDNSDMVVLAYLTDATGAIGDFYLCDTATATMADYVRLDGGNGKFLIILDPGDNINAPTGFNKTVATINNKTVTAWSLPDGSGSSDDKDKDEEDKEASNPLVLKVYAADLGLGIGAGSTDTQGDGAAAVPADGAVDPAAAGTDLTGADGTAVVVDNSYTDGTTVDPSVAAAQAAEAAAASVVTDAAGFVKAQPSEFYLIYGIDYNGAQGFFLYDTFGQTYQRYVEIDMGESEETAKYKKSAQIRLFIIAGLILFAVVLIFIVINMSLGSKKGGQGSRRYEGDDDMEEVKRRVKSKERRSIASNGGRRYAGGDDYGDDGYEDDLGDDLGDPRGGRNGGGYGRNNGGYEEEEDDVRYYDRQSQHTGRGVVRKGQGQQPPQRRGIPNESRPKVRTERRYIPPENEPGYGVSDETGDMGWNGQGGYDDGGAYGNSSYGRGGMDQGMDRGMNQDIDLDDDFNFDFIKPGK